MTFPGSEALSDAVSGSRSSRLSIFDTTLRDGDQAPGFALSVAQKVALARLLDDVGVDVIEAGFPISSAADYEACRIIAEEGLRARVAVMTRARPDDIARSARVFSHMAAGGTSVLHLSLPVSDAHIAVKLGKSRAEVLRLAEESVRFAKGLCSAVEMGAEDATRADREFLADYCGAVTSAGAAIVNIADTVGVAVPSNFAELVRFLVARVSAFREGRAVLSVHCHDDLGLALANTLAAVEAGAAQAEVTVAGVGERAGNACLETLAANLFARRRDSLPAPTLSDSFDVSRLGDVSRALFSMVGCELSPLRPVFGRNAHAHVSGIHQSGVLADASLYRSSSSVLTREGAFAVSAPDRILLGRHSGRAGLSHVINRLAGLSLPDAVVSDLLVEVKDSCADHPLFGITELFELLSRKGLYPDVPLKGYFLEERSFADDLSGQRHSITARVGTTEFSSVIGLGDSWIAAALDVVRPFFPDPIEIATISVSAYGIDSARDPKVQWRVYIEAETGAPAPRRYPIERVGACASSILIDCLFDIVNAEHARRSLASVYESEYGEQYGQS